MELSTQELLRRAPIPAVVARTLRPGPRPSHGRPDHRMSEPREVMPVISVARAFVGSGDDRREMIGINKAFLRYIPDFCGGFLLHSMRTYVTSCPGFTYPWSSLEADDYAFDAASGAFMTVDGISNRVPLTYTYEERMEQWGGNKFRSLNDVFDEIDLFASKDEFFSYMAYSLLCAVATEVKQSYKAILLACDRISGKMTTCLQAGVQYGDPYGRVFAPCGNTWVDFTPNRDTGKDLPELYASVSTTPGNGPSYRHVTVSYGEPIQNPNSGARVHSIEAQVEWEGHSLKSDRRVSGIRERMRSFYSSDLAALLIPTSVLYNG